MNFVKFSLYVSVFFLFVLSTELQPPEPLSEQRQAELKLITTYGPSVTKFVEKDLFTNNHVLAYYGHPQSKIMGIVGRVPKEKLGKKLKKHADQYDQVNGEKGVVPAFYLIYATVQPKGRIQKMSSKLLQKYIDFTLKNGYLLYIDHQIGTTPLSKVMDSLLPFLKYPHVHLAFDVEWRTDRPMKEIGSIKGSEINYMQKRMQDYIAENNILGTRQLVFHQFHKKMVRNPSAVRTDYKQVMLIHSTSGWGDPKLKKGTHAFNAKFDNMPNKAFKLWFFYSKRKGVHYDKPLMKPKEVVSLDPQPGLIIYQ